jgi:homoserine dehydrogenase
VTCTALGPAGFFAPAGPLVSPRRLVPREKIVNQRNSGDVLHTVVVLKFGSSVLRTTHDLPNVVHEIYRWYRQGHRVIAVVSAVGNTTERLIQESQALSSGPVPSAGYVPCAAPEPFATAELLATGERASAALLGIALDRAGVPARVVSPREIGFEVSGFPLDAEPTGLDVARIGEMLHAAPVLVVPGFFGTDAAGRTHCLGRGGSDLTAVFLAVSLYARCRLIKDVDGVYESDPAGNTPASPRKLEQLSYGDGLRVAWQLIQPKAVAYLEKHRATCEVAALASPTHSYICTGPTRIQGNPQTKTPRKGVVLLGCGTVGLGVYHRLVANPEAFCVLGVLVRDCKKHEAEGIPFELLHRKLETLPTLKPQLVIDALPGLSPSFELVVHFLSEGVDVVTANKATIAEEGSALSRLAGITGAQLRYSAAVGGAAPMLECCARYSGKIQSMAAVLNGTCNFVLETCARGASLQEAIAEAQRLGFAEAEPSEDLSGRDTARKLQLLARQAFRVELPLIFHGLDESVVASARAAAQLGQRVRQVSRAERQNGRVAASVRFERVTPDSPLFDLVGEWNALSLTLASGETLTVRGRGAGCWPTTEAVMADAFEILRSRGPR